MLKFLQQQKSHLTSKAELGDVALDVPLEDEQNHQFRHRLQSLPFLAQETLGSHETYEKSIEIDAKMLVSPSKSACTEGAEAVFACTHYPEAIAIAKFLLGGAFIALESCVSPRFLTGPQIGQVAKLGLNMAKYRPNMGPA